MPTISNITPKREQHRYRVQLKLGVHAYKKDLFGIICLEGEIILCSGANLVLDF